MPGRDPFIKPWMIDRANDHYALDIARARQLLDWQPRRSLRRATKLAGIRGLGKKATAGTPDAAAKPKPGEAPANPQPDRKAAASGPPD